MNHILGNFWKEVLLGKTFWRATLFEFSANFFKDKGDLNDENNVLELGGTVSSSHQRTFPIKWKMEYCDYVDGVGRDGNKMKYVFDANEIFPIEDDKYDGCVAYNTFPNIKDMPHGIKEMLRISRKFIIFTVPFVAPHGHHPYDWNRWTEDGAKYFCEQLKKDGLAKDYKVLPIAGLFGCIANLLDLMNKFIITRLPIYVICRLGDRFISPRIKTTCPMQFLVYIQK
jgi:hypothetical protein